MKTKIKKALKQDKLDQLLIQLNHVGGGGGYVIYSGIYKGALKRKFNKAGYFTDQELHPEKYNNFKEFIKKNK